MELTEKIIVLHVVQDDKFFETVISDYESDSRIINKAIYLSNDKKHDFKYINSIEKVHVLYKKKEIYNYFLQEQYDVVLFHSLPIQYWHYLKIIPQNRYIIWWAWGYDLYTQDYGIKPFIPCELYKPVTLKLLSSKNSLLKNMLKDAYIFVHGFHRLYYEKYKQSMLKRIDYFQGVIFDEYKLMNRNKGFKAKEYYKGAMNIQNFDPFFEELNPNGDILFGNSAEYSNNHIDVIPYLKRGMLGNRCIHIPLSYGTKKYVAQLKYLLANDELNIDMMEVFLPKDEYFSLYSKYTYLVSGVMRQQSMGNINYAIMRGLKIFLFKDSMVYNYLKKEGYIVYAIEDIDENSFFSPLTINEMNHNLDCLKKDRERRKIIYEKCLSDFENPRTS